MKTGNPKDKLAYFCQKCKFGGLKVTPNRVLIYQQLLSSDDHPTPDALYERVRILVPDISKDTVYRSLHSFYEIGLIDMVEGFTLTRRFEPNQKAHHHLRCIRCQAITDFYCSDLDKLKIPPQIVGDFDIKRLRITFEGLCSKCQSEINGKR